MMRRMFMSCGLVAACCISKEYIDPCIGAGDSARHDTNDDVGAMTTISNGGPSGGGSTSTDNVMINDLFGGGAAGRRSDGDGIKNDFSADNT